MAKKKGKKKKKKLSKYEKTVIREREIFRASKQPLVKKTHKLWRENPLLAPLGWTEEQGIELPKIKPEFIATVEYEDGTEEILTEEEEKDIELDINPIEMEDEQ